MFQEKMSDGAPHPFPRPDWGAMGEAEHFVQFYESEPFLLDSVSGFVSAGLGAGDACVVVAGPRRLEILERRLAAEGVDVAASAAQGRYVALDARDTLARIMHEGEPEWSRFEEVIGGVVERAGRGPRPVRVFGEMVSLLCDDGCHDAALRLEELWNDLQRAHRFSLFCAYPMQSFARESLAAQFGGVCAAHSGVIPAESYTSLEADDARLREIILLQQKARSLEAEIAERERVEASLRAVKDELEVRLTRERAARAEAEAANRLKDEFLATVSHELRTPLTAIVGWAHMMRRGVVSESDFPHALETIERNARSQQQLIEDLLDVSRIITGRLRLDVQTVDPVPVVDAAVESVRLAADAKGIGLRREVDAGEVRVAGDAARLQQVVWNLLSNAIKFTPAGGSVRVGVRRAGRHVEVSVADTGQGIAPEFLPHVFERFRQADGTTSRRFGGLGLGLSIVRHLVELHGGTVSAESGGDGGGATFTVSLPLAKLRDADLGSCVEETGGAPEDDPSAPRNTQSETLKGVRVLLVDDEEDTRELVSLALCQCGARVETARTVAEALELFARERPDVLIGDIRMPGEDGYDLIRKVRQLPGGATVSAVALTAYVGAEDRLRVLREGYQTHVAKPMEMGELVRVVAGLVKN
ncbi:MAG TPA: ATP-binding protein [Pyrinomonadaceae bacterium]|nr:ATP-binding protein [Pyrinomonadaceae bacterium]